MSFKELNIMAICECGGCIYLVAAVKHFILGYKLRTVIAHVVYNSAEAADPDVHLRA